MKIQVAIKPNAKETRITRLIPFTIALKAAPIKGSANDALRVYISKILGISKSQVKILHGLTSRNKLIEIEGISEKDFNFCVQNLVLEQDQRHHERRGGISTVAKKLRKHLE